jgi:hypothetical protein
MFDTPPDNLPTPEAPRPVTAADEPVLSAEADKDPGQPKIKKVILFVALGAIVVGAAAAAYWYWQNYLADNTTLPTDEQNMVEENSEVMETSKTTETETVIPIDTDNDGLTDDDEINIWGTNPNNPDSDNDGLTDNEEVSEWATDPLSPDSDGDSYSDGEEVENGYNPLGSDEI